MLQKYSLIKKIMVPILWLATGFLSWILSVYLFSYILSPFFIDLIRKTNAITQSNLIKHSANMIFTKTTDFLLCFIFAILLSYLTKSTKLRIVLFILGSIAMSLYFQIESLVNYMGIYPELPSWVIAYEIQGFVSILVLIPFFSLIGIKIGNILKIKTATS